MAARVIVVNAPGPQGPPGINVETDPIFVARSGSLAITGSNTFIGNQIITGSLYITGSGFYINGNRQFNYGAFSDTTTQTNAANVSSSFTYDTVDLVDGVTLVNNSRLTVPVTGIYNLQFSAQLLASANNTIVYIWIKKNGLDIANTATRVFLRNNEESVAAWNWFVDMNANDYMEIFWQSNNGNASLQHFDANGHVPAVPSIIVTVSQVA